MRYRSDGPGVMDFLFVSLFLHGKEQGYRRFNLGMAPLSSVGEQRGAHARERLARAALPARRAVVQLPGPAVLQGQVRSRVGAALHGLSGCVGMADGHCLRERADCGRLVEHSLRQPRDDQRGDVVRRARRSVEGGFRRERTERHAIPSITVCAASAGVVFTSVFRALETFAPARRESSHRRRRCIAHLSGSANPKSTLSKPDLNAFAVDRRRRSDLERE